MEILFRAVGEKNLVRALPRGNSKGWHSPAFASQTSPDQIDLICVDRSWVERSWVDRSCVARSGLDLSCIDRSWVDFNCVGTAVVTSGFATIAFLAAARRLMSDFFSTDIRSSVGMLPDCRPVHGIRSAQTSSTLRANQDESRGSSDSVANSRQYRSKPGTNHTGRGRIFLSWVKN